jgi:hypothetical protein
MGNKGNTARSAIIWQFNYGGSGNNYADAVVEVSDGFIIAVPLPSPGITGVRFNQFFRPLTYKIACFYR